MSGGIAYVYDDDGRFAERCNASMVTLERVLPEPEQAVAELELAAWLMQAGGGQRGPVIELLEHLLVTYPPSAVVPQAYF